MRAGRWWSALAMALALAACGGGGKVDCEKYIERRVELARKSGADGVALGRTRDLQEMACSEGRVSKAVFECVMVAASADEATECAVSGGKSAPGATPPRLDAALGPVEQAMELNRQLWLELLAALENGPATCEARTERVEVLLGAATGRRDQLARLLADVEVAREMLRKVREPSSEPLNQKAREAQELLARTDAGGCSLQQRWEEFNRPVIDAMMAAARF